MSVLQSSSGGQPAEDEDSFFDLLSRFQSKRMDDQRCSLAVVENKENTNNNRVKSSSSLMNNHPTKKPQPLAPPPSTLPSNGEPESFDILYHSHLNYSI